MNIYQEACWNIDAQPMQIVVHLEPLQIVRGDLTDLQGEGRLLAHVETVVVFFFP